jgi:hypothetical protein
MRVRPVQLATLLLLLATFGIADGPALGPGGLRSGVAYASATALRAQDNPCVVQTVRRKRSAACTPGPHSTAVRYTTAWSMRLPVARTAQVHAVTASRA